MLDEVIYSARPNRLKTTYSVSRIHMFWLNLW